MNIWPHVRNIGCGFLFVGMAFNSLTAIWVGFMMVFTGLVGSVDLLERQLKTLLEAKQNGNETEETESN